jgi:hypothetical protein
MLSVLSQAVSICPHISLSKLANRFVRNFLSRILQFRILCNSYSTRIRNQTLSKGVHPNRKFYMTRNIYKFVWRNFRCGEYEIQATLLWSVWLWSRQWAQATRWRRVSQLHRLHVSTLCSVTHKLTETRNTSEHLKEPTPATAEFRWQRATTLRDVCCCDGQRSRPTREPRFIYGLLFHLVQLKTI